MCENICQQLEAYLEDELAKLDRQSFDEHLKQCKNCQQEVLAQQQLDKMLGKAVDIWQSQPTPVALSARVQQMTTRNQNTSSLYRIGWGVGVAAAAMIVLSVMIWPDRQPVKPAPSGHSLVTSDQSVNQQPKLVSPAILVPDIKVSLGDGQGAIAVPVQTSNPNISIYFVYPTVHVSQNEPRSALENQTTNLRS